MNGLHLFADLHGCKCAPDLLLDSKKIEAFGKDVCTRNGMTVVGCYFHQFSSTRGDPAGVTGAVILAESHLALHTWPELNGVTLDVYVCNFSGDNSAAARRLMAEAMAAFQPERCELREVMRGSVAT